MDYKKLSRIADSQKQANWLALEYKKDTGFKGYIEAEELSNGDYMLTLHGRPSNIKNPMKVGTIFNGFKCIRGEVYEDRGYMVRYFRKVPKDVANLMRYAESQGQSPASVVGHYEIPYKDEVQRDDFVARLENTPYTDENGKIIIMD